MIEFFMLFAGLVLILLNFGCALSWLNKGMWIRALCQLAVCVLIVVSLAVFIERRITPPMSDIPEGWFDE